MTVTEFLEARIAEDEAAARRCAEAFPGSWDVEDRGYRAHVACDATSTIHVSELDQQYTNVEWIGGALQMIADFNPARVLAECAAKRAIVQYFTLEVEQLADPRKRQGASEPEWALMRAGGDTLRSLAAVYADHPDYDKDWAL